MSTIEKAALVCCTVLLLIFMLKEEQDVPSKEPPVYHNIVAFGDSLTFGFGATPSQSYPTQLSEHLGVAVHNAGINGELSAEGLRRLPYLLEDIKPDLVILCHGGNDIIQQHSRSELEANIEKMVQLILSCGSAVLLVGVPNFSLMGLEVLPLYKRIAQRYDLMFEEDILVDVLSRHELRSDVIHPNAKGYANMADGLYAMLRENILKD